MRKLLTIVVLALLLPACDGPITAPADPETAASLELLAALAYGVTHVADGPDGGLIARLSKLPPDLALSEAQRAQIKALVESFISRTEADRRALAEILKSAADARAAGKSQEEVAAILAGGSDIRKRLHEAELLLNRAVMATLTPAQRTWLAGREPPPQRPCTLTEAQRTEISGLLAAFEAANAADLAVHERARAAQQAGASPQEIAAILAEARPAMERLAAARAEVQQAILAVLTPEQRAAGCLR